MDVIQTACRHIESLFTISSHKIKKSHEVSTRSFNVKCVSEILKGPLCLSDPPEHEG